MGTTKYKTVEDLVDAVNTGVLTLEKLKCMYYTTLKKGQQRALIYRKAIYILYLEKLNQQWGENGLVGGG